MSTPVQRHKIVLVQHPVGMPRPSDFRIECDDLPTLQPGQVALRILWLSLDPYIRGRLADVDSYAEGVRLGETVVGETVAEVVESRDPHLPPGTLVTSSSGWQSHDVLEGSAVSPLDLDGLPPSVALGVMGMPGFTAYAGLLALGQPGQGETVVVAAACGPVGSTVGQIARLRGARSVGIAGGPEKVALLREVYGFDAAIDHRAPDFVAQLRDATPNGVDVYFENVGGVVGDQVIRRMNQYGRIPVCGLVAGINDDCARERIDQLPNFMRRVLIRSLTVRGFLQAEFAPVMSEDFRREMGNWVRSGAVRYLEDVTYGLSNAPSAFVRMLSGGNVGKALVRVAFD